LPDSSMPMRGPLGSVWFIMDTQKGAYC